ncbi:hypothetical protein BLA13014_07157 [Burkholderia aenigmatica]|uniref:Uncharacterized protein n=1 Tax=Burkholderia aenigmatica TaxID=2015348 RepID=A0A6P2S413_9BURK|nr:hypothetical protein BLA13014_07157 [Burkholderia aenigmatica]
MGRCAVAGVSKKDAEERVREYPEKIDMPPRVEKRYAA